jgi:hypothetical protein
MTRAQWDGVGVFVITVVACFTIAGSNIICERFNTIEGEAIAFKEAICEIIQRGFSHATFESDSKICD